MSLLNHYNWKVKLHSFVPYLFETKPVCLTDESSSRLVVQFSGPSTWNVALEDSRLFGALQWLLCGIRSCSLHKLMELLGNKQTFYLPDRLHRLILGLIWLLDYLLDAQRGFQVPAFNHILQVQESLLRHSHRVEVGRRVAARRLEHSSFSITCSRRHLPALSHITSIDNLLYKVVGTNLLHYF